MKAQFLNLYFNSIKVRLEHYFKFAETSLTVEFQFHKGAIRTNSFNLLIILAKRFQFHKGAIRTFANECKEASYCLDFNSIKVRLEPMPEKKAVGRPQFQFHKGAIRTSVRLLSLLSPVNFNSIKVRLELLQVLMLLQMVCLFQFHKGAIRTSLQSNQRWAMTYFNSIKVRLEHPGAPRRYHHAPISIP